MAPSGVDNCFDYLNTTEFSSSYSTPATTTSKGMSSSSEFSSHTFYLQGDSLCVAHTDHDYGLKPHMACVGCGDDDHDVDYDGGSCGDAMLSSCALDLENATSESTDTDFLKDLGELNFSYDDLNPCCEVAMEDSFQDFIDSALEQSYSPCLDDMSADNVPSLRGQDAVIVNKEQFLAVLELRPTPENSTSCSVLSPAATFMGIGSCSDSIPWSLGRSLSETANSSHQKVYTKGVSSNDQVPTRQCSCVGFEIESKAVYSLALPANQDNVQMCSSTFALGNKEDCNKCPQKGLTSEVRMSLLSVGTVSGGISSFSESSADESEEVAMEEDTVPRTDRDNADILSWLNERQEDFRQQDRENNNMNLEHSQDLSVGTELPNQNTMIAPSLDIESFADLEDFEGEIPDKEVQTHSGHAHQGPANRLKSVSNSQYVSQLKLSVFTEREDDGDKLTPNCFSHTYPENCLSILSQNSSFASHNDFSPTLSISDSNQSPFSPQHLGSMDLSFSSSNVDAIFDTMVKSPLALLNLFSDENAASLLHADPTVSSIRFM